MAELYNAAMATRAWAVLAAASAIVFLAACSDAEPASDGAGSDPAPEPTVAVDAPTRYSLQQPLDFTVTVTTTAFSRATGALDREHSCEGRDTSPPLTWGGVPSEAKSLVLILEDPESDELDGKGMWAHWVVYAIPPNVTELVAGQAIGIQGTNDYEKAQYSGPCPIPNLWWVSDAGALQVTQRTVRPAETRSYFFTLYALGQEVALEEGANRDEVLGAIDGHVVAAGIAELPYKSRKTVRVTTECAQGSLTLHEAAKCILVR